MSNSRAERIDEAKCALLGWQLIRANIGPSLNGDLKKVLAVACIQMQVWY